MDNEVVDDVEFVLVGMHIELLDVGVHEDGTVFLYLSLYLQAVPVPNLLVITVALQIALLFCYLYLLVLVQTG